MNFRFQKISQTFIWLGCLLSVSCITPARKLTDVEVGMSKAEVKDILGNPESVSLSFTSSDGRKIEVWDFKLAQYEMAMTISPYFDIYSLIFLNGNLNSWKKTGIGSRLSEEAALDLIRIP